MRDSALAGLGVGFVVVLMCGGLYGCPQYNVYEQSLSGEAALAKIDTERQVQVRDAQGKLDSAKLLADAEVERAKGAAKANEILMERLGGPEGYLRYLYIQGMENRKGDTIYIPTEAGLPILEARPKAPK